MQIQIILGSTSKHAAVEKAIWWKQKCFWKSKIHTCSSFPPWKLLFGFRKNCGLDERSPLFVHLTWLSNFPVRTKNHRLLFADSRSRVPDSRPPAAVALSYISSCKGKYFSFLLLFLPLNASHLSFTSGFNQTGHPAVRSVAGAPLTPPEPFELRRVWPSCFAAFSFHRFNLNLLVSLRSSEEQTLTNIWIRSL